MSIDPRIIAAPVAHPRGTASRIGDVQRELANLKQQAGEVASGVYPTLSGVPRTQQIGMPSRAGLSGNQSVSSGVSVVNLNTTASPAFDPYSGQWDISFGFDWGCPTPGYYMIFASVGGTTTVGTLTTMQAQVFLQASAALKGSAPTATSTGTPLASTVNGIIYITTFQQVTLKVSTNAAMTILGTVADTSMTIMQVAT